MADLRDGESVEIQGSARTPYVLKNVGGVYSCTCPAWRNQSAPIERRTCKHLRAFRGEEAEQKRLGEALPTARPVKTEGQPDVPPLLLAQTWQNDVNLAGWWMSEKLDGCRAWWDGRRFLSRQGKEFLAPEWFTEGLPEVPLDGELWVARRAFQRAVSIVRRRDGSEAWREVRYVVFDMPLVQTPFEERLQALADCLATHRPAFAALHPHQRCRGVTHLREELARVTALGGEGLMLRQPGSRYEAGRSSTLLKVKQFHDDDALVVDHVAGAGRHQGRMGALVVETADGRRFSIGTGFSDAERNNPPPIGSVVTYRYQELSDRGIPRFPSFVRVRTDLPQPRGELDAASDQPAQASRRTRREAVGSRAAPGTNPGRFQRRFEFVEGRSAKFWEVWVEGNSMTVRFGRLGSDGQSRTKVFADASAAQREAERLIAEKTGKGYVEA
ncbi:MAG: DNA ligase [Pirellulales bacterium]|nr:DNA ligase [Pirellulales bacterium]